MFSRATHFRTDESPQATPRAAALVAGLLACGAWFALATPARAIDLDVLLSIESRDQAQRDLDQAHENVRQARSAAVAAREELNGFLAQHFDPSRQPQPPATARPQGDDARSVQAGLEQLTKQLDDLRVHRMELLGYLTEEHPQVFDVDERIAAVRQQVESLSGGNFPPKGQTADEVAAAQRQWADYLNQLDQQREQDAVAYRQLYAVWQASELALDDALRAEAVAAQRIALLARADGEAAATRQPAAAATSDVGPRLPADQPGTFRQPEAAQPEDRPAAAPKTSGGSQPLALAALVIALAVAAVTAVRLARSAADPLFASADEVAAALAIPVVGIIPAAAARLTSVDAEPASRRRWLLVVQVVAALVAFALVVLAVQSSGGLWQLLTHPVNALRGAPDR